MLKTNHILKLNEIDENEFFVGNKTIYLKKLLDLEFNVPKFILIPSNIIKKIDTDFDSRILDQLLLEIKQNLFVKKYVVRSSSLTEDTKINSFAGQFLTKINLTEDVLKENIIEVINQAKEYLKGDLGKFSIIIQEYIQPDGQFLGVFAGIAFCSVDGRHLLEEGKRPCCVGEHDLRSGLLGPVCRSPV